MQRPILSSGHDGTQYHFYCDDGRVIAVWYVRFEGYEVRWTWAFSSQGTRILYRADGEPSPQGPGNELHLMGDGFEIRSLGDRTGSVRVHSPEIELKVDFSICSRVDGGPQLGELAKGKEFVLYYPNLTFKADWNGEAVSGTGFMKRWGWPRAPHGYHWLFLQGCATTGTTSIWSAEASFGDEKYSYFRRLLESGELYEHGPGRTLHSRDSVDAFESDGHASERLRYTPIGSPAKLLARGGDAQAYLSMTPVRFVAKSGSKSVEYAGIYERGFFSCVTDAAIAASRE